jgi:hypothetical protein
VSNYKAGHAGDRYGAKVSIPAAVHDSYGASYPITYVFDIPASSSGLTGWYRPGIMKQWVKLPAPSAGRFDGETCVRFDYPNNRAYLSAPFQEVEDDLYLRVMNGPTMVGTFVGVPRYYDNRRMAALFTYDDWTGASIAHSAYVAACAAHQFYKLWISPGVNADGFAAQAQPGLDSSQWADMNAAVTAGYVEPINHGLTHRNAAAYGAGALSEADDADNEIRVGAERITSNITMPPQSRRGSEQFVSAWVRPHGSTSAVSRSTLAANNYLADRTTTPDTVTDFVAWGSDGLYDGTASASKTLTGSPAMTEAEAVPIITAAHDAAYAARSIFTGYSYAFNWTSGWGVGTPAREALAHVAAVDDQWSVGYGHAHQYRKVASSLQLEGAYHAGFTKDVATSGTTVTAAPPTGTAAGNLIVAHHCFSGPSGSVPSEAGWTRIDTTGTSWNQEAVYWRVASGSEPASYTFSGDQSGAYHTLTLHRLVGVDTTTPLAGWARTSDDGDGAVIVAPATTATAPGLVLRIWSAPSGGRIAPPTSDLGFVMDVVNNEATLSSRPAWTVGWQRTGTGSVAAMSAVPEVADGAQHGWTIVFRDG